MACGAGLGYTHFVSNVAPVRILIPVAMVRIPVELIRCHAYVRRKDANQNSIWMQSTQPVLFAGRTTQVLRGA